MTTHQPLRACFLAAAAALAVAALPGCAAEEGADEGDEDVGQSSDALTAAARTKRAKEMFAAPIIARMYMPGAKRTIANKSAADVAKVLNARKPSMVSGLIRLDANPDLDGQEAAFADFRAVRARRGSSISTTRRSTIERATATRAVLAQRRR